MPFFRNYLIYVSNRVLAISRDGWRIGQRDSHRSSPCLFSTAVSTKIHLDRKRQYFYEFSVKKLVFWRFRGYLGEIESEKKRLEFFIDVFFSHSQWCVRVKCFQFLQSNLQWFTRYDFRKLSTFYVWPNTLTHQLFNNTTAVTPPRLWKDKIYQEVR